MGIRFYKPSTPGTRNRSVSDFQEITKINSPSNMVQKTKFLRKLCETGKIINFLG